MLGWIWVPKSERRQGFAWQNFHVFECAECGVQRTVVAMPDDETCPVCANRAKRRRAA